MDIQTILFDFLSSDELALLVKDIGLFLDCPILLVDGAFKVVAEYSPAGFTDHTFDGAVQRGGITYESISILVHDQKLEERQPVYIPIQSSQYERRFAPLFYGSIRTGYLICVDWKHRLRLISDKQFHMLELILAKQLFFQSGFYSTLSTTAEEILTRLLKGEFTSEALFRLEASSTYLAHFNPSRIALIDLQRYHNLDLESNVLKNELQYNFYASHPFVFDKQVILFLNAQHDLTSFKKLAKQFELDIVLSEPLPDLYHLPDLYRDAREAMSCLCEHHCRNFVVMAEKIHPLLLLRRLKDQESRIAPEIKALAEYDSATGGQYCLTLYHYLTTNHSLKETCSRMYLHRNTVQYRIRKIHEDFLPDLYDPNRMLHLLLSVSLVLLKNGEDALFCPQLEDIPQKLRT